MNVQSLSPPAPKPARRSELLAAFRLDPGQAGWRIVDGRALVVSRRTGHLHRLDRAGTEIWRLVAAASPSAIDADALVARLAGPPRAAAPTPAGGVESFLRELEQAGLIEGGPPAATSSASSSGAPTSGGPASGATLGPLSPRQLRIEDPWVITLPIEAASAALARRVGNGFLLRSPDGALSVLAGEAALLWDLVSTASRTYVELLDAVCERFGGSYADVETVVLPLVASWTLNGAVHGLERVDAVRATVPLAGVADGTRDLGHLDLMRLAASPSMPPTLRGSPTLDEGSPRIEHVAIVCQYGIHGLAPGVEPYTRRCIARLRKLRPDLVILAGGGRHGLSELREAESVVDRYRALLPGRSLWLEKHSETTWENLQHSLELLLARGIGPRRVTLLGDRSRVEKLRLACWLARRRFAPFRGVSFRVVPVRRPRSTWRDSRSVQIVVGIAQILRESRGTTLASAQDGAGAA